MRKQLTLILLVAISAFSISACKSKVDEAPKAQVEEAVPTPAPEAPKEAPADADKDKEKEENEGPLVVPVNTKKSTIKFIGAKITGDHHGGFAKWTGEATVNKEKNGIDKLDITIDMPTIYTEDDFGDDKNTQVASFDKVKQNDPDQKPIESGRLSKHLKDADFFDVEKFPKASFESTKIEPAGDKPGNFNVTGNLTLHGVTKSITFPAKIELDGDGDEIEAEADFSINRFDFGIKYPGRKDDLIKKDVRLMIDLDFPIEDEDEEHEEHEHEEKEAGQAPSGDQAQPAAADKK